MDSNKQDLTAKKQLGSLMRQCIKESGIKQNKVAAALNLSASRLSNYLNGTRDTNLDILSRFAAFFGKSLDYFNLAKTDSDNKNHRNEQYCNYLIAINTPVNIAITTELGIKQFKINSRIAAEIISTLNKSADVSNGS